MIDKAMTLRKKLDMYNKDSLKLYADYLNLQGLSHLKKAELVEKIADHLLDPDVMFYRMSIFDDRAIGLFERGIKGPLIVAEDEFETACVFNEMDLAVMRSRDDFFVPGDIAAVWEKVDTREFHVWRKRASWVWKCLYFAERLYGYTPTENMLDLINIKKGFRMKEDELMEVFNHFPEDRISTFDFESFFLSSMFVHDIDALKDLRREQADKDFYIPDVSEVEELFNENCLISEKPYQDMSGFMKNELGMGPQDIKDILCALWEKIAGNEDFHDTMQWFYNQFILESDEQMGKIVQLYMDISNNTRTIVNRGYKPSELHAKSGFGSGRMPVITAGSSHAASMLSQIEPEIRDMGFGLDLDSNAGRVSAVEFSNGINGPVKVKEKKIYPNDPCPCGSGKKYKKCCGRK